MLGAAINGIANLAQAFVPKRKKRLWEYAAEERQRQAQIPPPQAEESNTGVFLAIGISLVIIVIAVVLIRKHKWHK